MPTPGASPTASPACPGVELDLDTVQSNIVIFRLADGAPDARTVVARAAEHDVLVIAFAARTVRATTHLNVSQADCEHAGAVLARVIEKA